MKTSELGINLLCVFEDFRSIAYPDEGGVWTIGYGTTHVNGQAVYEGMTCTEAQAKQWLADEVSFVEHFITQHVAHPLTQNQFDAIVCFAYNVGVGGLQVSTLYKKITTGQIATVTPNNFTDWNKITIKGHLVPSVGLFNRRKREYKLFSTGTI